MNYLDEVFAKMGAEAAAKEARLQNIENQLKALKMKNDIE
jgi:hypothetical protein